MSSVAAPSEEANKEDDNDNISAKNHHPLNDLFDTVTKLVRETPESEDEIQLSNEDKLRLYGLYKHVHDGPCDEDGRNQPSMFHVVARAKYQAWESCRSYSPNDARIEYIELIASHEDQSPMGRRCRQLLEGYYEKINHADEDGNNNDNNNTQSIAAEPHLSTTQATAHIDAAQGPATTVDETGPKMETREGHSNFKSGDLDKNKISSPSIGPATSTTVHVSTQRRTPGSKPRMKKDTPTTIVDRVADRLGIKPLVARGGLDISYHDLAFGAWHCCKNICAPSFEMRRYEHWRQQISRLWSNSQQSVNQDSSKTNVVSDRAATVVSGLSVRTLLDLYLCTKQFAPSESQVIVVPPISVPGMMHVLRHHDLQIVPVDFGTPPNTTTTSTTTMLGGTLDVKAIEAAITNQTVAIMVVHPFGRVWTTPDEMMELRRLADAHGVELLEDCAECFTGLGGGEKEKANESVVSYQGSPLADVRFFSFGMIKTCTAVGGGIALVRDEKVARTMDRLQYAFYNQQQTTMEYLWKLLMCTIVKVIGSSALLYGLFAQICTAVGLDLDLVVTSTLRGFNVKVPTQQPRSHGNNTNSNEERLRLEETLLISKIRKRPSSALLALLHRRLSSATQMAPSLPSRLARCHRMMTILQKEVPHVILSPHDASVNAPNTFWLFPIIAGPDRMRISRTLRTFGFDVAPGASQLCCISKFADPSFSCPNAEKIMAEVLYLPVASLALSNETMVALSRGLMSVSSDANADQSSHATTSRRNCPSCKSNKSRLQRRVAIGLVVVCMASWRCRCLGPTTCLLSLLGASLSLLGFAIQAVLATVVALHLVRWACASFYLNSSASFGKYSDMLSDTKKTKGTDDDNLAATPTANPDILSSMDCLRIPETGKHSESPTGNKVLLTGATGFVGSLLLRDLLFHRKELSITGGVFVLCRKKRDRSAKSRISILLAKPMFAFLSEEEKIQMVHVVEGDVTLEDVVSCPSDLARICQDETISHVFHCAAATSFTQSLQEAAKANITSSLNLQSLTGRLKNKTAKFVHISTAFVHGDMCGTTSAPLSEDLFPLGHYEPIKLLQSMLGTQFYASKAMHDLRFPNTYTFSKCVCEHLLLAEPPVSTVIIRPSIVGPSVQSPFEGWAGDRPTTLVGAACLYMVYQWNVWCLGPHSVPYIPVDCLSRFVLAKAFTDLEEEGDGSDSNQTSTDGSFDRISQESDTSSDSNENIETNSASIHFGRIYNAAWDTTSSHHASFTWKDYAAGIAQLGSILGYCGRATAYVGLSLAARLLPRTELSIGVYQQLHYYLVLAPINAILKLCSIWGHSPRALSLLSSFVDLPLLFFPFTTKSFYFQSDLRAPDELDGERYLFSCVVAAHRFIDASRRRATTNESGANETSRLTSPETEMVIDMSVLAVGGRFHDPGSSDLWWALTQPRGGYAVRLAGLVFVKILRSVCSLVTVDATSFGPVVAALNQERNEEVHLILAPTHRSFFDFILLSFIFFAVPELHIDTPFIAAADDFEKLPLIGWLASCLGAFFVERGRGLADASLCAKLKDIKERCLHHNGACLEVFLEGTRSRDRRFVAPKTGFLRSLKQSGGKHIVVPVTISFEGIPEQGVLAEEAEAAGRNQLNVAGMLGWLKSVAMGRVSLGRIHVSASRPIPMEGENPGDFDDLVDEIQRRQQAMVVVSDYHVRAAERLLGIDRQTIRTGLAYLGCSFWPNSSLSCCADPLVIPSDPSELCTVFLQLGHYFSPMFCSTRPEWSKWLNGIRSECASATKPPDTSVTAIAESLLLFFDAADETAKAALSLLSSYGFQAPSLTHALQTAKRLNSSIPMPLLRAAVMMQMSSEKTRCSIDGILVSPANSLKTVSEIRVSEGQEKLGFWGFNDSGFVIQVDKKGRRCVTMQGSRYSLCGRTLSNLLPFIEAEMCVKVNPCVESPTNTFTGVQALSCRLDSSQIRILQEHFPKTSLSHAERARHGTGHSQEDVFNLRTGKEMRLPDAVVWPSSENDVEKLVELSKKMGWCLIPFGGGTNVSKATRCPPMDVEQRPIISVDMKEMRKILWLNQEDGLAHVQAGITGRDLVCEMKRRGFTIGHEPDSIEFSTLGGWIATKASGMKRAKYGNIEDIVKAVRVVSSEGILWKGDKRENVVPGRVSEGLDLCSLMMGSEGCLGIITSAVIRVWPLPECTEFDSIVFSDFGQGILFLRAVLRLGRNAPASVRLLDNEHFRLGRALRPDSAFPRSLYNTLGETFLFSSAGFDKMSVVCATICYEGSIDEAVAQKRAIARLRVTFGGVSVGARMGKAGYDLTFAIAYLRDFAMTYDLLSESFETFVPWSRIESVLRSTKSRVIQEHNLRHLPGVPFLGCRVTQLYHEGVCLYFYMCLSCEGVKNASEIFAEIEHAARDEILRQGGSLSHHHGVGKMRTPFLKDRASPAFEHVHASIKAALDKQNVFGARNGPYLR